MDQEKTQVSIRIPREMLVSIERIADGLDRDRTWVMLQAFKHYLAEEGAEILADLDSLAALDRGEGVDFDDMLAEAEAVIAAARQAQARKRA